MLSCNLNFKTGLISTTHVLSFIPLSYCNGCHHLTTLAQLFFMKNYSYKALAEARDS